MTSRIRWFLAVGALTAAAVPAEVGRNFSGGSAPVSPGGRDIRLLCWNIERGLQLEAVGKEIARLAPVVALLQEVDIDAHRSGGKNVAGELARAVGLNYAFAEEWEELGQGTGGRKARQGQAVLTALRVRASRSIQFRAQSTYWQPRWFLPNWPVFQRRDGGRIAQVLEVETGGRLLVLYNVHLESRGVEELRRRQMEEVTADLRQYPPETAIVVAGDLNTRVPDPPAVKILRSAGFRQAAGGSVTTRRGVALDWIFVRGPVAASEGEVHVNIHASDHFPLTTRVRWGETRQTK